MVPAYTRLLTPACPTRTSRPLGAAPPSSTPLMSWARCGREGGGSLAGMLAGRLTSYLRGRVLQCMKAYDSGHSSSMLCFIKEPGMLPTCLPARALMRTPEWTPMQPSLTQVCNTKNLTTEFVPISGCTTSATGEGRTARTKDNPSPWLHSPRSSNVRTVLLLFSATSKHCLLNCTPSSIRPVPWRISTHSLTHSCPALCRATPLRHCFRRAN